MILTTGARRFIGGFASAALCCFGGIGLVNYLVDPAHLFDASHATERNIAQLLRQGNVGGVTNLDERLLQKYRIKLEPAVRHQFLVIGSSSSMQVSSQLTGADTLNLSVSGASIEDFVAISEMASAVQASTIILGVDPWVFNLHNDQSRWKSLSIEYAEGLNALHESTAAPAHAAGTTTRRRLFQLLNFDYTKASLRALPKLLQRPENARPFLKENDQPERDSDVLRPDGSLVYSAQLAGTPSEEVRKKASLYGDPPVYSLDRFVAVDPGRRQIFESLVRQLHRRADVWILLPPYHPAAYPKIVASVPMVRDVEQILRALAQREGLRLLGSYDPSVVGCQDGEFYDGRHPKETCLRKVFGH